MSRPLVTLALAAGMSIGLEGGQSGAWQWTSAHGPPLSPAGRVLTVGDAVVVSWFSATWRSLDDGDTWQPASRPLQSRSRVAAAHGQLYVETQNGVIRSSDVGESFEPCGPLPVDRTTSRAIENLVADGATIYVSIRGEGTFRSRDSCASWSAIRLPPMPWVLADGLFAGNGLLVLRGTRTLVSTDRGETWHETVPSLLNPLGFAAGCDGAVFAATATGVRRSNDGGRSWMAAGLSGRRVRAVSADGCEYLAAIVEGGLEEPSRLMESADGGHSWTGADEDVIGQSVEAVAIARSGRRYLVGRFGAFRSSAGGAWRSIGPIGEATSLAATSDSMIVRTSGGSTFEFDTARNTWQPLTTFNQQPRTPGGASAAGVGTDPSTELLFARLSNGVLRSSDRGRTWRYDRLDRFPHAMIALSDGTLMAGTEDGVFLIGARDDTWLERSAGLKEFRIAGLAAGRGRTVYAASWEGQVYRSMDRGERWTALDRGLGGPVSGLLETREGTLLVATAGRLFRWDHGERTWSAVKMTAVDPWQFRAGVSALMQMRRGTLIVGGNDSLFVSNHDGRSWSTAPSPDGRVYGFAEDARGRVHAATTSGLWFVTVP